MYECLRAEMARKKVKQVDLANMLEMSPHSIYGKMSGRSNFSIEEAAKIKKYLETEIPIEILFDQISS